MKRRILVIVLALLLFAAAVVLLLPRAVPADALYINGHVYTLDPERPEAEALALKGDRIVGVGSTRELEHRFAPDSLIDLKGKPVYPGFIDAHAHVEGIGVALQTLHLAGLSLKEIIALVRKEEDTRPAGMWIRGRGWDQNLWSPRRFPGHQDLDAVCPNRPVYLVRVDGHAVWVNRKVLELAGINRKTPDPPGGKIIRDGRGNATGVFLDHAMDLLASFLPPPSQADRIGAIRQAARKCLRYGITEVQDMGVGLQGIKAYRSLLAEEGLPFRFYVAIDGTDTAAVLEAFREGPQVELFGGRLTIRAIKLYADGALGSRGAALIEPYSDDPGNRGLTLTSQDELEDAAEKAAKEGFQLCVHAIGDRANLVVLNAYEQAFRQLHLKGFLYRFRVEHAQVLEPSDIPRFAMLGVIPSMQPLHCTSDMPWAMERLGRERIQGAYAWKSLIRDGCIIPAGSDAPVEEPDVCRGFYAAITRQREDGAPPGGWNRGECMSREEALKAYTIWAAFAAFQEKEKGSLEVGKWADFVVLSDDLMTVEPRKIPSVRVELTVVGGEVGYRASAPR